MQLSDLQHTIVTTPQGSEVIVLENGALINAEADAMLQALHSRSVGGLRGHLKILEEKGADKFMSTFYVGYGHKSIGDCGSTTIFIENVSMLAAKAVQQWPLYSGQEASTRYIDFSEQPFISAGGSEQEQEILESCRSFYLSCLEPTIEHLKQLYPIQEGEKKGTWERAIHARAFDTCRGFLPAGAQTNLAWHTNLRQAADKVQELRHHPLQEVRDLSQALEEALKKHYKSSFDFKQYEETEKYLGDINEEHNYYHNTVGPAFALTKNSIDTEELSRYKKALESRPAKTELPKQIASCGTVRFEFQMDFASFRDLQRHRAVYQQMPLLTTELGFHTWYIENLAPELHEKTRSFLTELEAKIHSLNLSQEDAQYLVPMGYLCSNQLTGNLHALTYLIELRANRFTHPTLQIVANNMGQSLIDEFADYGLVLHIDKDLGRFDAKRGDQTILAS